MKVDNKRFNLDELKNNPEIERIIDSEELCLEPVAVIKDIILAAVDDKGLSQSSVTRAIRGQHCSEENKDTSFKGMFNNFIGNFVSSDVKSSDSNPNLVKLYDLRVKLYDIRIEDCHLDTAYETRVPGSIIAGFEVFKIIPRASEDSSRKGIGYRLQYLQPSNAITARLCQASKEDKSRVTLNEINQSLSSVEKINQSMSNIKYLQKPVIKVYQRPELIIAMYSNISLVFRELKKLNISDQDKLRYYYKLNSALIALDSLATRTVEKEQITRAQGILAKNMSILLQKNQATADCNVYTMVL